MAARRGPHTVGTSSNWSRITNQEVFGRANSPSSIEAKILQAQLPCSGHVIRMDETRIPRQLFYGELVHGSRCQGRPRKRYKDKTNINWADLQPRQLEGAATNRTNWRALIRKATANFEDDCRQGLATARDRQHSSLP